MKKLNDAIDTKNTKALLSLIDSNIECSFGGNIGWDGFINMWHPDSVNTGVWILLKTMMEIGGTTDSAQNSWVFPYVFALPNHYDPFFTFAITGKNVPLRVSPNSHAKIVVKLNYDIMEYDDTESGIIKHDSTGLNPWGDDDWYCIKTFDNKYSGYVYWENIWSPVGYRFFIEKENGGWRMKYFVGGD